MSNLIFNAFAFKENYKNTPQLEKKSQSNTLDIYMKNICVSLITAKMKNPRDCVALVTNKQLPEKYLEILNTKGIEIVIIPFDEFIMPSKFSWALAFFKLCALKYIVNNTDYDHYLLLDTDTITVNCFQEIWEECTNRIMLYNVGHSLHHKERELIIRDYKKLFGTKENIDHYGGEFIAGSKANLKKFMDISTNVYERIVQSKYDIADNIGDETITSIAAYQFGHVVSASPYINRYWTGRFYLVSTNYYYNPVCVWHLPYEKDKGMLKMYDFIKKNDTLPSYRKMVKMLGLPKCLRTFSFSYLFSIIKNRWSII